MSIYGHSDCIISTFSGVHSLQNKNTRIITYDIKQNWKLNGTKKTNFSIKKN